MVKNLPRHLGGHFNVCHSDEATLNYMIGKFGIKSMYDVGCGLGCMVKLGKSKGLDAVGIDGDFTINYPENITIIVTDFTKVALSCHPKDMAWSCEFLEHIEERFMDNYFSVFRQTKVVVCTFCDIQGVGHHHVNVKNQQYWDDEFKKRGFTKDQESTNDIRKISSMKRDFVRNTGTVYLNLQR